MISVYRNDTIAALATPPGRGGIAIVRVSGEHARTCFDKLFIPAGNQTVESHRMLYGKAVDEHGDLIDECMGVVFFAPRTYTREDVAEFQIHGGDETARRVLKALMEIGCREAEPGEFTKRAFMNGRIDLSQAEAVMKVISAESEQAAKAAERQLAGGVSSFVRELENEVTEILAGIAAALDYPEEISEEEAAGETLKKAERIADKLVNACNERKARYLESGFDVVLCGRPNVGKSSILNALLCEERAIVTDIPGTTRDIVRGSIILNGIRINLADTAGIRDQTDAVEAIGVQRAKESIKNADLVLLVLDASQMMTQEDKRLIIETNGTDRCIVCNKTDLGIVLSIEDAIYVSAQNGDSLVKLKEIIVEKAGQPGEMPLTSARHMRLALEAATELRKAADQLSNGEPIDLASIDIQQALEKLGEITGDRVDEKLLDSVFSNFCVGK